MVVRVASTASVLVTVAFVLQLLPNLTAPVSAAIALGDQDGIQYGVFGYCKDSDCTSKFLYNPTTLGDSSDFSISESVRSSMSKLLILHPIGAGLTLILLIQTIITHLHSANHSSLYLLNVWFWSFIAFALSTITCVTDILLFYPHLGWAGWLNIGSTVVLFLLNIVLCLMRSSASRKKKMNKSIENDDLEFENFNHHKIDASDDLQAFTELKLVETRQDDIDEIALSRGGSNLTRVDTSTSGTYNNDNDLYQTGDPGHGTLNNRAPDPYSSLDSKQSMNSQYIKSRPVLPSTGFSNNSSFGVPNQEIQDSFSNSMSNATTSIAPPLNSIPSRNPQRIQGPPIRNPNRQNNGSPAPNRNFRPRPSPQPIPMISGRGPSPPNGYGMNMPSNSYNVSLRDRNGSASTASGPQYEYNSGPTIQRAITDPRSVNPTQNFPQGYHPIQKAQTDPRSMNPAQNFPQGYYHVQKTLSDPRSIAQSGNTVRPNRTFNPNENTSSYYSTEYMAPDDFRPPQGPPPQFQQPQSTELGNNVYGSPSPMNSGPEPSLQDVEQIRSPPVNTYRNNYSETKLENNYNERDPLELNDPRPTFQQNSGTNFNSPQRREILNQITGTTEEDQDISNYKMRNNNYKDSYSPLQLGNEKYEAPSSPPKNPDYPNPAIQDQETPRAPRNIELNDQTPRFNQPPPLQYDMNRRPSQDQQYRPPPLAFSQNNIQSSPFTIQRAIEADDLPSPIIPFESDPMEMRKTPPPPSSPADSLNSHFTSISQRGINPKYLESLKQQNAKKKQKTRDIILEATPEFALDGLAKTKSRTGGGAVPRIRNRRLSRGAVPSKLIDHDGPYGTLMK